MNSSSRVNYKTTCVVVAAFSLVVFDGTAFATDTSKTKSGDNHLKAHATAQGTGRSMAILDIPDLGIKPGNNLGARLISQHDFTGKTPSQAPGNIAVGADDHATLTADTAAGGASGNFIGVAPKANVYFGGIDTEDSLRAATNWLNVHRSVFLYNISAGFGANDNGANNRALYLDWLQNTKDVLVVKSSGNDSGQLTVPGDFYNGITVGAMNESDQSRRATSNYQLNGGGAGTEVRGKPDILAPGENIGDGFTSQNGTSFAAPHVTGTAALLMEKGLGLFGYASRNHLAIKALILNSARKRFNVVPDNAMASSLDSAAASATFDKDYLKTSMGVQSINDAAAPANATEWTPSAWTITGGKFSTTKPLDDEQGVGFLDVNRALINMGGGEYEPGLVGPVGWDRSATFPGEPPANNRYAINQVLGKGAFITATLCWDRLITEIEQGQTAANPMSDGNVEDGDTYAFSTLTNLDLRILDKTNTIIAESISTTDNVEHLHFPVPALGMPGDYKIEVAFIGGTAFTNFGLAWWTVPEPASAIISLSAICLVCLMRRK